MFAAIFVMRFYPTLRVAVMCEDPEKPLLSKQKMKTSKTGTIAQLLHF